MTTTAAGGKITGILALTCKGSVALQVGDWVHLIDDYEVGLADGTKPVLGRVSVRNVKRTSTPTTTSFPVGNPGGDVTVEARGYAVFTETAGAAIAAGDEVGINNASDVVPVGAGVAKIGVALMTVASGAKLDVLMQ